jgi:hypothetical protein
MQPVLYSRCHNYNDPARHSLLHAPCFSRINIRPLYADHGSQPTTLVKPAVGENTRFHVGQTTNMEILCNLVINDFFYNYLILCGF